MTARLHWSFGFEGAPARAQLFVTTAQQIQNDDDAFSPSLVSKIHYVHYPLATEDSSSVALSSDQQATAAAPCHAMYVI